MRRRLPWFAQGHAGPILALALVHGVVFARSLFLTRWGIYVIPHDFEVSYHRFLIYAADCFRSGSWPLWNPLNAAGTPFFVNPQNQAWSPITLLVVALGGYTHRVAQCQLFLTVLLGGVGAYLLAYRMWGSRIAALFAGLCFDLTSAVFTNMQHMDIVNACALVPWLLWAAFRCADGRAWAFPLTAFLMYWQITWGYPTVVTIGFAWLGAAWLWLAATRFPDARSRVGFLGRGAAAAVVALGLSAVLWIPVLAHLREFSRGSSLDIQDAMYGSLSFPDLWGMVFHAIATTRPEGAEAEPSMFGVYFGVLPLALAAAGLVLERRRTALLLGLGACASMMMAAGGASFVRVGLNWLVAPLNFSRFPAAGSRAVMVLFLCALTAAGVRLLERGDARARRLTIQAGAVIAVLLAAGPLALRALVYRELPQAQFHSAVMGGAAASLVFLLLGLAVLARGERPRVALGVLFVLVALDLGTAVHGNYAMVGQREGRAAYRERRREHRPRIDPSAALLPRVTSVLGPGVTDAGSLRALTAKQFHLSDYGGFRLRRFDHLLEAGFGDWLATGPRAVALPPDSAPTSFADFRVQARPVEFRIAEYRPNLVRYEVTLDHPALLVFNEVNFPGWRGVIDGRPAEVVEVAGGLRGLRVDAGARRIETRFQPPVFRVALAVSALAAFAWGGWVVLAARKGRSDLTQRAPGI